MGSVQACVVITQGTRYVPLFNTLFALRRHFSYHLCAQKLESMSRFLCQRPVRVANLGVVPTVRGPPAGTRSWKK